MSRLFGQLFRRCALPAMILCWSLQAPAQDATGRVIGVITDPSGSVIPKAKVTVTNVETRATQDTVSDVDGSYQVLLLPIGTYTISAEAPGFRKAFTTPLRLEINQSLKIDLKLEVGTPTETVQVDETATTVETVNSTVATSVTASQIVNAPLNGRNVFDLVLLENI